MLIKLPTRTKWVRGKSNCDKPLCLLGLYIGPMRNPNGDPYMLPYVRAISSAVAELCKMQKKMLHFVHFNQKNSH